MIRGMKIQRTCQPPFPCVEYPPGIICPYHGLLIKNTQICKWSLILSLWSDFTPPGYHIANLLISREMQHVSQKQLQNSAKNGSLTNARHRLEPGCLFLHVPCTLASKSIFHLTFLGVRNWPKKVWPCTNFLSRSNEGRQNFLFATENVKRPASLMIYDFQCTNQMHLVHALSSLHIWRC